MSDPRAAIQAIAFKYGIDITFGPTPPPSPSLVQDWWTETTGDPLPATIAGANTQGDLILDTARGQLKACLDAITAGTLPANIEAAGTDAVACQSVVEQTRSVSRTLVTTTNGDPGAYVDLTAARAGLLGANIACQNVLTPIANTAAVTNALPAPATIQASAATLASVNLSLTASVATSVTLQEQLDDTAADPTTIVQGALTQNAAAAGLVSLRAAINAKAGLTAQNVALPAAPGPDVKLADLIAWVAAIATV